MRTKTTNTMLALSVLLLSACGKGPELADGEKKIGVPVDELEEAAVAATAAAAPLRCPPKVRKGLNGPDIMALRLGMTLEEALATARCGLGEDAVVTEEKRWLDRIDTHGIELGTQFFTVEKGSYRPCNYAREWQECRGKFKWEHVDEVVSVATPGGPGKETAAVIWRTQNFRDGQMPPVDAALEALIGKYGQPQIRENSDAQRGYSAGYRDLQWVYDRAGNPLSKANPLFDQCRGAVHAHSGDKRARWREGCGLNIAARVSMSGKNPGLAMELTTVMVQQSDLYAQVEAMRSDLQRVGQARREEEIKEAGDASDVRL
ncbi:hypothetical protein [Pseudoxanthomonas wuyuanensis]|uniref:Lipoprotein n=1 Tax=Pseudoxanthomonas wuyuanensis TaxID=1073196 RepID=A0A286D5T3_9GAMM|nr:hypothetical protein [Pseudoxanthomonas wuyuanensis]SOD54010.1 hypothetical protein SAMN06296416_10342 [Pseudoxanthomonas wuyuanensis]